MQNETSTITKGDMIVEKEMHSNNKSKLVRERDFYRAKMNELKGRIKTLEYDNAELIKRDQVLSKRVEVLEKKFEKFPSQKKKKIKRAKRS